MTTIEKTGNAGLDALIALASGSGLSIRKADGDNVFFAKSDRSSYVCMTKVGAARVKITFSQGPGLGVKVVNDATARALLTSDLDPDVLL